MDRPIKESLSIEFKSDRRIYSLAKLNEDLVGLANTSGGWLFLGVEDDGTPSGVDKQHRNCRYIEAWVQDNTVPALFVHARIEAWDGRDVLAIEVPISRQLMMTSDGKYLRRRLKRDGTPETVAMRPDEIMQRLSYLQMLDPSAMVIEGLPAAEALSALERERLREMVRTNHGDAVLLELTDDQLDRALGFVRERDGKCFPHDRGTADGRPRAVHPPICSQP